MRYIMLDLETMDTTPDAAIAAIGAVVFDPSTDENISEFYCRVDIESSQELGGTIGADTVKWWLRQPSDARAEIACKKAQTITEALADLNLFILSHTDFGRATLWAKGTDFDLPILTSAMRRCQIKPVWDYHHVRDVRTFMEAALIASIPVYASVPFDGIPHHALHDARHQAALVSFVWRELAKAGATDQVSM